MGTNVIEVTLAGGCGDKDTKVEETEEPEMGGLTSRRTFTS